ncbi:MAG TPA: hypothetical protein VHA52_04790 [Candidatus Babeliaceae bacterium]|nr:hypothetical protein [Candidatus Babeliaceae bacterium]
MTQFDTDRHSYKDSTTEEKKNEDEEDDKMIRMSMHLTYDSWLIRFAAFMLCDSTIYRLLSP